MGKDLGYAGEILQDFVKQQQDYERGERIAERELERDRIAAKKDKLAAEEAKADKERELERDKLAAQGGEIELAKITAERGIEMARIEGIAEQAERDRELKRTELESKLSSEIELEKLKHSFEMKHLEVMGQLEVQRATFKTELEN